MEKKLQFIMSVILLLAGVSDFVFIALLLLLVYDFIDIIFSMVLVTMFIVIFLDVATFVLILVTYNKKTRIEIKEEKVWLYNASEKYGILEKSIWKNQMIFAGYKK